MPFYVYTDLYTILSQDSCDRPVDLRFMDRKGRERDESIFFPRAVNFNVISGQGAKVRASMKKK